MLLSTKTKQLAWLINTISMSEKSALQTSVDYADARHINGKHTTSLENEHETHEFNQVVVTDLAVHLAHGELSRAGD